MKNKRFNAADVLMILVALISVLAIIMRINHGVNGKYLKDETYNITVTASGLTEEDVKELSVGAGVSDGKGKTVGTLSEGYWIGEPDENGLMTLEAGISCSGIITENGFLSGGVLYKKGDSAVVTMGKLKLTVTVTDFVKTE